MAKASDKDAFQAPMFEGFQGISKWKETLRQTQNSPEGLHMPSELGPPWNPQGGAGKCCQQEKCLEPPATTNPR